MTTCQEKLDLPAGWITAMNHMFHTAQRVAVRSIAARYAGSWQVESWYLSQPSGPDLVIEVPLSRWDVDQYFDPEAGGRWESHRHEQCNYHGLMCALFQGSESGQVLIFNILQSIPGQIAMIVSNSSCIKVHSIASQFWPIQFLDPPQISISNTSFLVLGRYEPRSSAGIDLETGQIHGAAWLLCGRHRIF